MALKRDIYLILGVPPVATMEEIKKAYRTLTKKYHPDLNPEMKLFSDEKMKELVEAYNILSDLQKRKEYNRQPHFMLKRPKKGSVAGSTDPRAFSQKPTYDREPSMLERILSPFMGKKVTEGDKPVRVDQKQADVHFTMAMSMADNESFFNDARKEFKEAVRYNPNYPEALYNYALLSYKLGEFDEARIHFQKYLFFEKEDTVAKQFISILSEDY
jgi:curved DNA-binding protein CbpA